VSFSPCSQLLATCSQDNTVKIFTITEKEVKLLHHLQGHHDKVCGVAWNPVPESEVVVKQKRLFWGGS
jgi:WD40 repeat protein